MRVLDTDTCIEILRGNEVVIEHRAKTEDDVATSWMTACELYYGAQKSSAPAINLVVVRDFLATLPVLGPDSVSNQRFGILKATLEGDGERLADADLLIASVTMSRGAVLVTGNHRHYERIAGLPIEDWIRG